MTTTDRPDLEGLGRYAFGWADSDEAGAVAARGPARMLPCVSGAGSAIGISSDGRHPACRARVA